MAKQNRKITEEQQTTNRFDKSDGLSFTLLLFFCSVWEAII